MSRITIDIERDKGGDWVATLGKDSVRAPTKWGAIRALVEKQEAHEAAKASDGAPPT